MNPETSLYPTAIGKMEEHKKDNPAHTIPFQGNEGEIVLDDEILPLIPEGDYSMSYKYHETTAKAFGTPKVFVYFTIVEPGPYFGTHLYRSYRVRGFIGKHGKNGRFKLGKRNELFLVLCRLNERETRLRPDRVSLQALRNAVVRATVRTVKTDYKQRPLPQTLHYSVIDELISVEAGTVL